MTQRPCHDASFLPFDAFCALDQAAPVRGHQSGKICSGVGLHQVSRGYVSFMPGRDMRCDDIWVRMLLLQSPTRFDLTDFGLTIRRSLTSSPSLVVLHIQREAIPILIHLILSFRKAISDTHARREHCFYLRRWTFTLRRPVGDWPFDSRQGPSYLSRPGSLPTRGRKAPDQTQISI